MIENMTPQQLFHKYQKLTEYCTKWDLYETVRVNEQFYDGDQWNGVKTDLPKPVINILQRVVKYLIASISSNEVAVSMMPFSSLTDDQTKMGFLARAVEQAIEQAKMKEKARLIVRNTAVDGSSYLLLNFNPDFETNQDYKGIVEAQVVDNTQVYFGNPYSNDLQKQPYIIIALRQYIGQVKEEAKANGIDQDDIDQIKADNDATQPNDDSDNLVTVLLTFAKVKKDGKQTVVFTKSVENCWIKEETDLGYSRYPLSVMGWEPIKNSYLYSSPLTSVIYNQIFINKCFAIAQMYGLQSAFPKIIYDSSKGQIDDLMDNTRPSAVANIDMMGKVLDFIKVPDFSNQIIDLINTTIQQTKECMGVNDAAMGNVKPDNTSAIIALQEATNVPLEIQRQAYFEFWEETVRNLIDIMIANYNVRKIITEDGLVEIDYNALKGINYELNVDVGQGAQYSQIAQINTLDKLFQAQLVDGEVYLDSIPDKYLMNKEKIKAAYKEKIQQQQQMMQQQAAAQAQQPLPTDIRQ